MSNLVSTGRTSFGADGGSDASANNRFRARLFVETQRWHDLDRRQSYYDCTQHDYKRYDFDGRIISAGGGIQATQPLLSAEKISYYIPLRARRPASPYRLARVIVNAFSSLVFGEGRFPTFKVEGDDDTQDYVKALVEAMQLPTKMIRARNLGGAVGSVGLSWCFLDGKPRCSVHNARDLFVHEWEDREQLVPRHVTELIQHPEDEWDGEKRRYVRNLYWYRRDWTPNADIIFKPVKIEPGKEPNWVPDLDKSESHNDGICHFVWIQNLPSEEIDGIPDYEGLYEAFDTIDLLLSVITKGATLNLDPTLKLKMDPDLVNRAGVRKGSDNALTVGEDGDASYLELGGQSIEAGVHLFEAKRRAALEVAQCVIPDPDQVTANGTSAVAMKILYAPMIGKTDLLREQYANGMVRMLQAMVTVARDAANSITIQYDDEGNEIEVQREVLLPPRIDTTPVTDDDGKPTGEKEHTQVDRDPGDGGQIVASWGPYFQPTPTDQQSTVSMLSTAVGGEPIMSVQTATELAMVAFGRNPDEEVQRVTQQQQQQQQQQQEQQEQQNQHEKEMMAAGGGGQVPPGGGKPPFGGGGGKPPGKGGGFGGGKKPPGGGAKPPKPPKPPKKGGGGGGGFGGNPKFEMA